MLVGCGNEGHYSGCSVGVASFALFGNDNEFAGACAEIHLGLKALQDPGYGCYSRGADAVIDFEITVETI